MPNKITLNDPKSLMKSNRSILPDLFIKPNRVGNLKMYSKNMKKGMNYKDPQARYKSTNQRISSLHPSNKIKLRRPHNLK